MRLLPRSPRNSRPRESIASVCGPSISPGALPFLPQVLMNLPVLSNLTMRALVLPPWPSATKMSPLGATSVAEGALNSSGPLPATPGLPSVINTLPSGLNLNTWWPLPSFPSPSITHTFPSGSTERPCGNNTRPAPKLFTSLPDSSNLRIGSRFEPSQPICTPGLTCDGGAKAPQRSATQMLLPSISTPMPAVEPQLRPSGSFPNGAPTYGLGREFVGATAWE